MYKQLSIFSKDTTDLNVNNYEKPALLRDIPFDKIYEAARKEASRKKPVFFTHKYFARRITSSFRMMLIGSLLPYDKDIWNYIYESYDDIDLDHFTILDPFMGGGTTIFEASRLNTRVIGSDLQPLSRFVTTSLVKTIDVESVRSAINDLEKKIAPTIKNYYQTKCPHCQQLADIMYTFHAKKVKTDSPCKEHILYSSFVLALKKDIFTLVCPECGEVYEHNFKDGPAICPSCNHTIESPKDGYIEHGRFKCEKCKEEKNISEYKGYGDYPFATKLIAIEYYCPHCGAHGYKKIDPFDQSLYDKACSDYDDLKNTLPIPDQNIPDGYNTRQILNHGYTKFCELFNKRQLLCLGLLLKSINEAPNKEDQFWLQLAFSGMLEMNNMFCRYQTNAYKICNIFFNHAYVPITMPVENNVWGTKLGTGTFIKTIEKIIRGKKFCSQIYDIYTTSQNGKINVEKKYSSETVECTPASSINELDIKHPYLHCGDSRDLSFIDDNSVDMVLTDPPFGANVMYSELIDFFHVWNYKSTLSKELGFLTPLSPKNKEIIVNETRNLTQENYSNGLMQVFKECYRVTKNKGLLIFSFHDKSIDSWRSVLESVDRAGFRLIKSYPLHSETRTGAHTSNKNSIALDIMLIYRKKQEDNKKYDETYAKEIYSTALKDTEDVVKRLDNINAEITVPDIQNIFISKYFCGWSSIGFDLSEVFDHQESTLISTAKNISSYFTDISIAKKRTGWWSELYHKKWELD